VFVCVPAGGLWRCDRVLSIGVAVPCQSQSVKSVSIVHSTGRSISHDYPVNLSINLSVSVGACTKNNTRPRALTFAVRSSALSISSLSSSHLFEKNKTNISSFWSLMRPHHLSTKSRCITWSRQKDCRRSFKSCSSWSRLRTWNAERILELRGEISMLDVWKVVTGKSRICRRTGRGPRKWNEKAEDNAPTIKLGSSNETTRYIY